MQTIHHSRLLAILFCLGSLITGVLIVLRYQTFTQILSLWGNRETSRVQSLTSGIVASVKPQVQDVHSSDGSMNLKMLTEVQDSQITVAFTVSQISGENPRVLFTRNIAKTKSMGIPYNTWSPDNKYVFLQEKNGEQVTFLVFNVTGENFVNDKYLDIGSFFSQKITDYQMTGVTGWASNTLLIVTTSDKTGQKGPSFWFDITSRAFIQLARH